MKLSRKSDYALRALLHLASQTGGDPVPVSELARENEIPRKFLEAIMRELREIDIVESIAGKRGGYRLTRNPFEISIGPILRHFDGHLESAEADFDHLPDDAGPRVRVQMILRDIGDKVDELMNRTTLGSVIAGEPIHYEISDRAAFVHGDGI